MSFIDITFGHELNCDMVVLIDVIKVKS